MAITAISSILTAGLFKIGYKVAENKKWLPKSIYHRLSLKKIKEGDLKQAIYFNSIAIKKNPDYENALIVRDIISMHKDAQMDQIQKKISAEEDNIQTLIRKINENKKRIKKQLIRNKTSKIFFINLLLVILFGLCISIFYNRNFEIKYMVWLGVLIILTQSIYILVNRKIAVQIKETIARQEQEATLETFSREIKVREKRLDILKNELKEISGF